MKILLWFLNKLNKFKWQLVFLIMAFTIVKLFVANYEFQQPIVSKRAESYQTVWNDRAILQQQVDAMTASRDSANSDILNDNIK